MQQRPPVKRLPGPDDFERAKIEIRNAPDRDTIGQVLSLFVARYFARVVLWRTSSKCCLDGSRWGPISAPAAQGRHRPLHLPSVFQHSVANRTYHIGKIEPNMINSAFLAGSATNRRATR